MVITANNIPHYQIMSVLADKQPIQEPITKAAALIEQPTLEENLLKLCSQLRDDGFDIYADSVEEKFLALKTADVHMYHVHDEDGEDLVDRAHPDGDHHVEDGELGDVETIVSQHKKMLEVVKKTPTGKLAQYVEMCRIVLAQANTWDEIMEQKRANVLEQVNTLARTVGEQVKLKPYGSKYPYNAQIKKLRAAVSSLMGDESITDAKDAIDMIATILEHGMTVSIIS